MSLYYDQTLSELLNYSNVSNVNTVPFTYNNMTQLNTIILESTCSGLYLFTFLFSLWIIVTYQLAHCCCVCSDDCSLVAFKSDEAEEFALVKSQNTNYADHCLSFFNKSHFWLYCTLYSILFQCACRMLQSGFSLSAAFYYEYSLIRTLDTIFQVVCIPLNTWILFCFIMIGISVGTPSVSDKRHRVLIRVFIGLVMFLALAFNIFAIVVSVLFEASIDAHTSPLSAFNRYWSRVVTIYISIPVIIITQAVIALLGIMYSIFLFEKTRVKKVKDKTCDKHHPSYDPVMNLYRKRTNVVLLSLLLLQIMFCLGIASRAIGILFIVLRTVVGLPLLLFVIFMKPVSELIPIWSMFILLYPMPLRCFTRPIGFNLLAQRYSKPKGQDFRRSLRQSTRITHSPISTTETTSTSWSAKSTTPRPMLSARQSPFVSEEAIKDGTVDTGSSWRMSVRNHSRVLEWELDEDPYEGK